MKSLIRIATRKSPLALWQAEYVKAQLNHFHPHIHVQLVPLLTQGDILLDTSLSKIGGKGLFVKQLEVALLNGDADIAVHSMKDVPMDFPEGLGLQVVCERGDPRDAFVATQYHSVASLPPGSIVGTSSLRRQCQLLFYRPDLVVKELRGNIGSRLNKLEQGEFDAIILAAAGLQRLSLTSHISEYFSPDILLPAAGQGAIGIETRSNDMEINALITPLNHTTTRLCVDTERALNRALQGGCQVPIACHAKQYGNTIRLAALVGTPDGSELIYRQAQASTTDAIKLAQKVATVLHQQGAGTIINQLLTAAP